MPDLAAVEHGEGLGAAHGVGLAHAAGPVRHGVHEAERDAVDRGRRAELDLAVVLAEDLALALQLPLLLRHVLPLGAEAEPPRRRVDREPHRPERELRPFHHRRPRVALRRVVVEDPVALAEVLTVVVRLFTRSAELHKPVIFVAVFDPLAALVVRVYLFVSTAVA